jgi:hypothetical protein
MDIQGRSDRGESTWSKVGVIAGIIAAVAAVAVFIIPVPSSHPPEEPTATPGPRAAESGTAKADTRFLSDLTPQTGDGLITATGQDLAVPCPSNQSDDTEREFSYNLTTSFRALDGDVTVSGDGGPDATASVQAFTQHRQDRSDRIEEAGRAVVPAATTRPLTAALGGAAVLTFRVRCSSEKLTVHLIGPALSR